MVCCALHESFTCTLRGQLVSAVHSIDVVATYWAAGGMWQVRQPWPMPCICSARFCLTFTSGHPCRTALTMWRLQGWPHCFQQPVTRTRLSDWKLFVCLFLRVQLCFVTLPDYIFKVFANSSQWFWNSSPSVPRLFSFVFKLLERFGTVRNGSWRVAAIFCELPEDRAISDKEKKIVKKLRKEMGVAKSQLGQ